MLPVNTNSIHKSPSLSDSLPLTITCPMFKYGDPILNAGKYFFSIDDTETTWPQIQTLALNMPMQCDYKDKCCMMMKA